MLLILFLSSDWPCDHSLMLAMPLLFHTCLPSGLLFRAKFALIRFPSKPCGFRKFISAGAGARGAWWCENGPCFPRRCEMHECREPSSSTCGQRTLFNLSKAHLCSLSPAWLDGRRRGGGGKEKGRQGRALFQLPLRAASCDPRRLTFCLVRRSSASFVFCH